MSSFDSPGQGLNILCIDGGGARGLSALILVEELMNRIQPLKKLDSPPHPYQCFDLIAGTGTGAVQACMLGRLRMPVQSAIESYASLAKNVFSEKKRYGSGSFKTTRLKESLRKIIQHATGDPNESMLEHQQTIEQCKTLVFAMSKHNMRAAIPTAFRSYPVASNTGPNCPIWQTLCATVAHPDLFKSFDIGDPPLNRSFVDAGVGCNNPLAHVLTEVKALYPDRYVSSITSIGTGHTRTIQIPNTSLLRHLLPIPAIVAMKAIATDTERVAEDMARRFNSTNGVYFRLNVDQGMQDVGMDGWEQLSEVLEHTSAYMKPVGVSQRISKVAEAIHSKMPSVPTAQIDGEIQPATASASMSPMIRRCPAPSPIFTGCEQKISGVESCITGSTTERKVCIVHGLGGAGKTQIALKVVERTYGKWKEVLFIDASTRELIESALKEAAIAKQAGDTYKAALQWLESCHEPWLLVLDNADDPSVPIRDYIPRGHHGSVIITTRLSGMLSLAQGTNSDCSVSSMDPDDALLLLLKAAQKQEVETSLKERGEAKKLLQELGHFAVAVVHAGSFIGHSPHISIADYRALLMRQNRRALEAYSKLPQAVKVDDYGHTVYTAWLMCYEQLGSHAQKLLWLFASLHHTGITIDIFRRASQGINSYKPTLPTTPLEDAAQQQLQNVLCNFLDSDHSWDELLFTEAINEISSRSLLEYDAMNQAYRIHVLVQTWVHTVVPYDVELVAECARTLLSVSIPLDWTFESIMYRISIGPHVDKVLSEGSGAVGPNHADPLFRVLMDRGQWARAELLITGVQETMKHALGLDHPDTLSSMYNLAYTYSYLGQYEDARALQSQVLHTRKQVLGLDHPDTLRSMNNLAVAYSDLGRHEDARALHFEALDTWKKVLGKDHPDTLSSMNNLANTYSDLGQHEDAKALHFEALDTRKQVLGKDHPDTLSSMNNLANTYLHLGQHEDAGDLHFDALDIRKQVLGKDHPDALRSMNNLGVAYSHLGRHEGAKALHSEALNTQKQVLGKDHPDTLLSMYNLACTYSDLGRYKDARSLHSEALNIRKQVLGKDHPDTLRSMNNLANTYSHLGRHEDASELHSEALDTWKQVLGEDHLDTLLSMNNLAYTYKHLGRHEDARALHSGALDTREQVLGKDHPDTLRSMNNLANAYSDLGRHEDATALHSGALDIRKQVLGKDHPDTLLSMYNLACTYSDLGRYEAAKALHFEALDIRKQALGIDHPDTLKSIIYLSEIYLTIGQMAEAEKLQIPLDKYIRTFGENHEWTNYAQGQLEKIQNYRKQPSRGLNRHKILVKNYLERYGIDVMGPHDVSKENYNT
ncbi:kinesin light chain [Rhizoctonia solani 123E]|uniref:Kinesin light chain n=1 Tax=Rhizoctonia solani 123E TaxID=1423351 RepID=A0A074S4A1_9AGAM|nr:kinesin light chain [Rhizoctonia solani 123E]